MKWLSDQLVFKSSNNFPVNPYADYTETKKENVKTVPNISESNVEINNTINNTQEETVNNINNAGSSVDINKEEKMDDENNEVNK